MGDLLEHLGKDTLPKSLLGTFVQWCVWEQARPALVMVLEKTQLVDCARDVSTANNLEMLTTASERAAKHAQEARKTTGPLGLSAAEAAAFETVKLLHSASGDDWDPESVAFFAARVCGWAGWAETGFSNPAQKASAETAARSTQEKQLSELWRQSNDKST